MHQQSTAIEIAAFTDTGLSRDHNEDCVGFDVKSGIAVLADGMGGHQAGEIASRMAVEQVLRQLKFLLLKQSDRPITSSQMLDLVSNTISDSNRKIFEASERLSSRHGMGTTVVAAVVEGSNLYAGHVGDSRLYLLRDGALKKITKDHSLVQDLVDKGFYTEDEAKLASINHVVTRALGTACQVEIDILQQEAERDDLFLLCSDGLSDMLSDSMIEQALNQPDMNLDEKAQNLVAQANQHGGKDNVSVILIRVRSPGQT
jgi:serine/threonine protein phosphatase PrpC